MANYKMPIAFEVRASPGKGRGTFATRAIKRGETIETAPAVVVPKDDVQPMLHSFLEHYLFQTDDGKRYVMGLGYTAMINHSDKPNAEFFVTMDRITIKTTRAIKRDEEIFVDYGWTEGEWERVGGGQR